MAKFTAGIGFGQASGSVSGNTYSKNRFGPYIRNRAIPTNPQSARQMAVRSTFGNLSQTWRTLTASQRAQWISAASTITLIDPLGQTYRPSGPQFYVGLNQVRLAVGLASTSTPVTPDVAAVVTSSSATAVGSTGAVTVTFAPAIGSGAFYELSATAPVSAGRSYFGKSQYRVIAYLDNADTSPFTATTAYAAVFGSVTTGTSGKKIAFKLTPIDSKGFRGTPFMFEAIVS